MMIEPDNDVMLKRTPRPYGVTAMAILGDREAVQRKLTFEFFRGTFPMPGKPIPIEKFKTGYGIDDRIINKVMMEEMTIDPDLLTKRSNEVLPKILSILGNPQSKAQRLTGYLESTIYGASHQVSHLLIQQLISSINLERQNAETIAKFLTTTFREAEQFFPASQSSKALTKEEAIELLARKNSASSLDAEGNPTNKGQKDLSLMEAEISQDPTIPNVQASSEALVVAGQLARVPSEYNKLTEVTKPRIPVKVPINPI